MDLRSVDLAKIDAPRDKRVYFVRHGESVLNARDIHQPVHVELSARGREQAHILAQRVSTLQVDRIISSSAARAKQTAEIIGTKIGQSIASSALFLEGRRPAEVIGKPHADPGVQRIHKQVEAHYSDADWHFSDEENYADLRNRARKALEYVLSQPERNIVVVTHGIFIAMLLSVMAFGDRLSPQEALAMRKFTFITNTGITICDYVGERWRLVTFNDYAHLG